MTDAEAPLYATDMSETTPAKRTAKWEPRRWRHRPGAKQFTRSKRVVLDRFDEAILTFALREEFGRIWIVENYNPYHPPVESPVRANIADCGDSPTASLYIPVTESDADTCRRSHRAKEYMFFNFVRSRWIYSNDRGTRLAYKLPTIETGAMGATFDEGDRPAVATMRKLWRILRNITTNTVRMEYPHLGYVYFEKGRVSDRFGWHAMEWCAREPDRMLDGRIRPPVDFEPPQSEWYQKLRRKVIARYGDTLEDPGPPEVLNLKTVASAIF